MTEQNYCERDERGYRIPQRGTQARAVYERMDTESIASIAADLGCSYMTVAVTIWRIKHPSDHNAASRRAYRRPLPSSTTDGGEG